MVQQYPQLYLLSVYMENFKYAVLILCVILISCQQETDYSRLVVEGWIEDGKHPIVMVHKSYSLDATNEQDGVTLADVIADQMVLFGRVAISDGTDTVVLTGKVDTNYMPPYIYTTVFMRGEAGKTYHLIATNYHQTASASTTIPVEKPIINYFSAQQPKDAVYPRLIAHASHLVVGEYYIVMVKTHPRGQYKICPLGVFQASRQNLMIDVKYYSTGGLNNISLTENDTQYDTIYVKLAHIGEKEYRIWDSFAAQSITQGIFFIETHNNIETNIQNGNGYWCGMAAGEYKVSLTHLLSNSNSEQ